MASNKEKKHIKYSPQFRAAVNEPRYRYEPEDRETHNRSIMRKEVRGTFDQMYRNEQERDQRAYERIKEAQNMFYAGVDPRRRQEVADSGMVFEDHNAMANLSPVAIHREYPKSGYYSTPYIDDGMRSSMRSLDDNDIVY